ncbi:hypothetical protein LSAT2_026460 [Lamellibrachia satsuma]|nr:hypothetical protein LSAT2_026460 [Lamellibrachia satsuma]
MHLRFHTTVTILLFCYVCVSKRAVTSIVSVAKMTRTLYSALPNGTGAMLTRNKRQTQESKCDQRTMTDNDEILRQSPFTGRSRFVGTRAATAIQLDSPRNKMSHASVREEMCVGPSPPITSLDVCCSCGFQQQIHCQSSRKQVAHVSDPLSVVTETGSPCVRSIVSRHGNR